MAEIDVKFMKRNAKKQPIKGTVPVKKATKKSTKKKLEITQPDSPASWWECGYFKRAFTFPESLPVNKTEW